MKISNSSDTKVCVTFLANCPLAGYTAELSIGGISVQAPSLSPSTLINVAAADVGSLSGVQDCSVVVKGTDGSIKTKIVFKGEIVAGEVGMQEIHCAIPVVVNLPARTPCSDAGDIVSGGTSFSKIAFETADGKHYEVTPVYDEETGNIVLPGVQITTRGASVRASAEADVKDVEEVAVKADDEAAVKESSEVTETAEVKEQEEPVARTVAVETVSIKAVEEPVAAEPKKEAGLFGKVKSAIKRKTRRSKR